MCAFCALLTLEPEPRLSLARRQTDLFPCVTRCRADQGEAGTVAQGPAEEICNVRRAGHQ